MPTTSTARIANDSPFCEAYAAMDKIIERLMTMAGEGATADEVTRLLTTDGTALLRDLMQGYFDRCAEREPASRWSAPAGSSDETPARRRVGSRRLSQR